MIKQWKQDNQDAAKSEQLRDLISDTEVKSFDILQEVEQYFKQLTPQEREVMRLVLYGYNQTEISEVVGYSQQHVSRIIRAARVKANEVLAHYKKPKYKRKKRRATR